MKKKEFGYYKYIVLSDNTIKLTKYFGKESVVTVPSMILGNVVSIIGASTFFMNNHIKEIILPDTICEIEPASFAECTALRKINIPKKVQRIENKTFEDCICLEEVIFESSNTDTGEYAFINCSPAFCYL